MFDTSITAGPTDGSMISDSTPTFSFTSPDGTATFECSVDAGGFSACTSAFTTATLPDGPHTFAVRAKDTSGNTDASPAMRSFTVSTGPPPGDDSLITGKSLKLNSGSTPSAQKLSVISTDQSIAIGAGNGSIDDPTNTDVKTKNGFAELSWVAYPWLIPAGRWESLEVDSEKSEKLSFTLNCLARANVKSFLAADWVKEPDGKYVNEGGSLGVLLGF